MVVKPAGVVVEAIGEALFEFWARFVMDAPVEVGE
jgi:hypothetical protein